MTYDIGIESSSLREIDIKFVHTAFFRDKIATKKLDPNNIMKDERSYKNILICHISYVTLNSVKSLYIYHW